MSKLLEVLSFNLKRLRREKHFSSQEALAEKAKIGHSIIKTAEEKRSLPGSENLEKIAAALGVSSTELFREPASASDLRELLRIITTMDEPQVARLLDRARRMTGNDLPTSELSTAQEKKRGI